MLRISLKRSFILFAVCGALIQNSIFSDGNDSDNTNPPLLGPVVPDSSPDADITVGPDWLFNNNSNDSSSTWLTDNNGRYVYVDGKPVLNNGRFEVTPIGEGQYTITDKKEELSIVPERVSSKVEEPPLVLLPYEGNDTNTTIDSSSFGPSNFKFDEQDPETTSPLIRQECNDAGANGGSVPIAGANSSGCVQNFISGSEEAGRTTNAMAGCSDPSFIGPPSPQCIESQNALVSEVNVSNTDVTAILALDESDIDIGKEKPETILDEDTDETEPIELVDISTVKEKADKDLEDKPDKENLSDDLENKSNEDSITDDDLNITNSEVVSTSQDSDDDSKFEIDEDEAEEDNDESEDNGFFDSDFDPDESDEDEADEFENTARQDNAVDDIFGDPNEIDFDSDDTTGLPNPDTALEVTNSEQSNSNRIISAVDEDTGEILEEEEIVLNNALIEAQNQIDEDTYADTGSLVKIKKNGEQMGNLITKDEDSNKDTLVNETNMSVAEIMEKYQHIYQDEAILKNKINRCKSLKTVQKKQVSIAECIREDIDAFGGLLIHE